MTIAEMNTTVQAVNNALNKIGDTSDLNEVIEGAQEHSIESVTFEFSESSAIRDGSTMTREEADTAIQSAIQKDIEIYGPDSGYSKTIATIAFTNGDTIEARMELSNKLDSSLKEYFDSRIKYYTAPELDVQEWEKESVKYWKSFNYKY